MTRRYFIGLTQHGRYHWHWEALDDMHRIGEGFAFSRDGAEKKARRAVCRYRSFFEALVTEIEIDS